VLIKWQVDPILHGDQPDFVDVLVNGRSYSTSATSEVTIDAATVKNSGTVMAVEVDFVWRGNPEERQAAGVNVALPGGPTGITPSHVHERPRLVLKERWPKTLQRENGITVFWSSYSINEATLHWGAFGGAANDVNLKISAPNYNGDFTTDRPLIPAQDYEFTVTVRNTFEGWGPYTTGLAVRSASNYVSMRDFLAASHADPKSLRRAVGPRGLPLGLRALMGV
jgi:hypothetical protein